ncbi:peptide deformylase [Bacteroidales bacterium]|nr:peptide deformylase [Bacteroidales bacterium]
MILPIYLYGQPILRQVSKNVDSNSAALQAKIANMFETMYHADGIGLAAPQVGIADRLLVLDLSVLADQDPDFESLKMVMINANILECFGEDEEQEEGCLSLPAIHEKVIRKNKIRVSYLDEHFVAHESVFEGFLARVIQHEYDHLEGRLFIDGISGIRKQLIKSKLNKMIKGDVNCSYKYRSIGK